MRCGAPSTPNKPNICASTSPNCAGSWSVTPPVPSTYRQNRASATGWFRKNKKQLRYNGVSDDGVCLPTSSRPQPRSLDPRGSGTDVPQLSRPERLERVSRSLYSSRPAPPARALRGGAGRIFSRRSVYRRSCSKTCRSIPELPPNPSDAFARATSKLFPKP